MYAINCTPSATNRKSMLMTAGRTTMTITSAHTRWYTKKYKNKCETQM